MSSPEEVERKKKLTEIVLCNSAYLMQRAKANARKKRFLEKMTPEQKEQKRARDREYKRKKKEENGVKAISDMTEGEKKQRRMYWKKASRKYREKQKSEREESTSAEKPPEIIIAPLVNKKLPVRSGTHHKDRCKKGVTSG